MTENTPITPAGNGTGEAAAQLSLQKVYIKDASFEVPGAPQIFQEQGQPQVQLNLSQQVGTLADNIYEVVLTVTVTCKLAAPGSPTRPTDFAPSDGMFVFTAKKVK